MWLTMRNLIFPGEPIIYNYIKTNVCIQHHSSNITLEFQIVEHVIFTLDTKMRTKNIPIREK